MPSVFPKVAGGLALAACFASPVWGGPVTISAADSAIVGLNGPEAPPDGKQFFDVVGRGNGPLASYAVLEFDARDFHLGTIADLRDLSIMLTQDLHWAAQAGAMSVFITTDTTTSLQYDPRNPAVVFDPTDVHGLGSQLQTLYPLGTVRFNPRRTGATDTFPFLLMDADVRAYLVGQINAGGLIRVVFAPEVDGQGSENVQSAYFGTDASVADVDKPTVSITVTAEVAATLAADSAVVGRSGPEAPPEGKQFFDVVGRDNGSLASFGVVEFDASALNLGTVTDVRDLAVTLTQDPQGGEQAGVLRFFLTTDTATSIQYDPTSPAVVFDASDPHGLNGQLAPLFPLGMRQFTPRHPGATDGFIFPLVDPDLRAYLVSQINVGGVIRVVVTPEVDSAGNETLQSSYFGSDAPDASRP